MSVAQLVDQIVRVDDVAARLGHLLVVLAQDDALVEQPQERLVEVDQAHVAHRLGEEARVEQVHRGVLDPAGVLVDRHQCFMAGSNGPSS